MEATALETAFTTISGNLTSAIADVAPIAITVFGAILVWRVGVKVFKILTKG